MATLYIVATPIGNLEDITLRALRILREVDLILCEDTRVTKKLLAHYDIKTPTESYPFDRLRTGHLQKPHPKIKKIIRLLQNGKNLALVTDSGTPTISDPGSGLVKQCWEVQLPNIEIVPIPGPSALIAALSASGLPASEFLFLGFLPHKKGREKLFKEIVESKRTIVFYESPHRLIKTLASLKEHLDNNRRVIVAKELTKIYEEVISGTAQKLLRYFETHNEKIKGEFVIIIGSKS